MLSSTKARLVLVPLGRDAWRLCDAETDRDDPSGVVAYVELVRDGVYDVVWVSPCSGTARFPCLDDVLDEAAQLLRTTLVHGPTKPIPIPHLPPLAH